MAMIARRAAAGRPVARTTAGRVVGERAGRLNVFRGVPYAEPPLGELRFASPRPPRPWSGDRDATAFAAASLQSIIPGSGEDSLYANVWTPDTGGSHPVLVYVHGGGWAVGAGSLGAYDGARLADRGNIVVVTFNYRLGVLGFGPHPDLEDPVTGASANWGLQDQIALLRWVRENVAGFGGDPDRITVAGTSAGGASAWQLALLPELRGIVAGSIPISACPVWEPVTALSAPDSRAVYESIAEDLGATVRGLREVPAALLVDRWEKVFSGPPAERVVTTGREYRGPVRDGRSMAVPGQPATPDVPLMVVHTRTEGSFYTGSFAPEPPPAPAPTDEGQLRESVRTILLKGRTEVDDELVTRCVATYREYLAAEDGPTDPTQLWTEVWGDGLFRHGIVRRAERHAAEGRTPLYLMEFAHPVLEPYFGTPHEATSPFLFGTFADPDRLHDTWGYPVDVGLFARGPAATAVSETFIDLVASFVRDGVPRSAAAPDWPEFTPDAPSTLVLGTADGDGPVARVATASKRSQLRFWDDIGWGRSDDPERNRP